MRATWPPDHSVPKRQGSNKPATFFPSGVPENSFRRCNEFPGVRGGSEGMIRFTLTLLSQLSE